MEYERRPNSCRSFECWWLSNENLGPEYRPYRIGAYAAGDPAAGYLRVMVDSQRSPTMLVDAVRAAGLHALVSTGDQISFVQGDGTQKPQRILLDWVL